MGRIIWIIFVAFSSGLAAYVLIPGTKGVLIPGTKKPNTAQFIFTTAKVGILCVVVAGFTAATNGVPNDSLGREVIAAISGVAVGALVWAGVYWFKKARAKVEPLAQEQANQPRVFISYRREDGAAQAGRIADRLEHEFGPDHVFMDVDAIRLGADFVKVINEEVAKCDVLLAVMGRNWLDVRDQAGQRLLDAPVDFVRLEIAAALTRQIPVIPILIDNTKIPPADKIAGRTTRPRTT